VKHYLGVAKAAGVDDSEVGAVQGICMAVSAGRINAQMKEVEKNKVGE